MNQDIIKIILQLLPDCRAAAMCSREWYDVYLTIPDHEWWMTRNLSLLLPKMYGIVWRGSVYDLAVVGNTAIIHQFNSNYGRYHWEQIGAAAAISGNVDLMQTAIAMGGKNICKEKIWANGAGDRTVAVWKYLHASGVFIPKTWLEFCCVETLQWYITFVPRHVYNKFTMHLCNYACVEKVEVIKYLHELNKTILHDNIILCDTIFKFSFTESLRYLVENGGNVVVPIGVEPWYHPVIRCGNLEFIKYSINLIIGADPYEIMFSYSPTLAAEIVMKNLSIDEAINVLRQFSSYNDIITTAAKMEKWAIIRALITPDECAKMFPFAPYPFADDTWIDFVVAKLEKLNRAEIAHVWGRTAPDHRILDRIADKFQPTDSMLNTIFRRIAQSQSIDLAVAFFQRHNYRISENMVDDIATVGRFDIISEITGGKK